MNGQLPKLAVRLVIVNSKESLISWFLNFMVQWARHVSTACNCWFFHLLCRRKQKGMNLGDDAASPPLHSAVKSISRFSSSPRGGKLENATLPPFSTAVKRRPPLFLLSERRKSGTCSKPTIFSLFYVLVGSRIGAVVQTVMHGHVWSLFECDHIKSREKHGISLVW